MCKQSPAWSSERGVRGDLVELTRTDFKLAYLLSQFMSARPDVVNFDAFAPKAALPIAVGSVHSNELRLLESAVAACGAKRTLPLRMSCVRFGPSLSSPTFKCVCKVRTGTPSPTYTDCCEDQYPRDCTEDSADDASASTGKEANCASDKAAHYSAFHFCYLTWDSTSVDVCYREAALQRFCAA